MTHIGVLHISAVPQTCHDVDDTRCSGILTIPGGAESLKPTSLMCSGPGAVYVGTCNSTVYLLSFPSGGSRSWDSNCRPGICSRNSVLESNRRQQTRHTSHSSGKHLGKIAERKDLCFKASCTWATSFRALGLCKAKQHGIRYAQQSCSLHGEREAEREWLNYHPLFFLLTTSGHSA